MTLAVDGEVLARALLTWYAANRRDLPWRRTEDPYRIWVSEIMLQQTQVATVVPYYERFLARFPTVCALAEAPLDELLALWQGLGYYSRARNLHAAASIVCAEHGGQVPSERGALLSLPGIGEYTAGAILSIAYHADAPAVDGNVTRVLCRLFDYAQDPAKLAGRKALRAYATALIPSGHAGELNQAMMELGATLCVAKVPDCVRCPVASLCLARERGTQAQRPLPRARPAIPRRQFAVALVIREGRVLIVRRVPRGLLGGMWELPGGIVAADGERETALSRLLLSRLQVHTTVGEHVATIQHAYTHFSLTAHVYRCALEGKLVPTGGTWDSHHWLAYQETERFGLTGVTTKILAIVPWEGSSLLL